MLTLSIALEPAKMDNLSAEVMNKASVLHPLTPRQAQHGTTATS